MSELEPPQELPPPEKTKQHNRFELTGKQIGKWVESTKRAFLKNTKSFFEKAKEQTEQEREETLEDTATKAPAKALNYVDAHATKQSIENQLNEAKAETEFQKCETEKLSHELIREQKNKTKAETRKINAEAESQELDNIERRLELMERYKELTAGKPKAQVVRQEDEEIIVFGELGPEFDQSINLKINELDLPQKACDVLQENDICCVGDLCEKTEEEILELKGIGPKYLEEIKSELDELGCQLAPSDEA